MRVLPYYYVAISRLPLAGEREGHENLTHCSISQVLLSFEIPMTHRATRVPHNLFVSDAIKGLMINSSGC
jgi:hypothetical protein